MKFDASGRLIGAPIAMLALASAAAAQSPVAAPPPPVIAPPPPVFAPPPAPPAPVYPDPPKEVPDAGPYQATLTGYVVQPSGKSMTVGEDHQLREHDVILRGKLSWFRSTRLPEPVVVHAMDVDFPIKANANLRLAVGLKGGDLATLGHKAQVFCDEPRNDARKAFAQLATAGLSAIGSRIARDTQVCLVDSDGNADFDEAFVIGAKKAPDRHLIAITPVPYTARTLDPIPGDSEMTVEFLDGGALSGPALNLAMKLDGRDVGAAAFHFFSLLRAGIRVRIPSRNGLKPNKLPQPVFLGVAGLEIKAWDPAAKVATVSVTHDFGVAGFVVEYPPQMIFIYY